MAVVSDNGLWYRAEGQWLPLLPEAVNEPRSGESTLRGHWSSLVRGLTNKPGFGESKLRGVPLDFITEEQLRENGAALARLMQKDRLSLDAAESKLGQYWFDHSANQPSDAGRAYFDGSKVYVVWKTYQTAWVTSSRTKAKNGGPDTSLQTNRVQLAHGLPLAAIQAIRRIVDVDGITVTFYQGDADAGFTVRACRPSEQVEQYLTAIAEAKSSVEINGDPNDSYLSRDDGGRRALMRIAQTTGVLPVAISEHTAPARVSLCPACNAPLPPRAQRCSFCNAYIRGG